MCTLYTLYTLHCTILTVQYTWQGSKSPLRSVVRLDEPCTLGIQDIQYSKEGRISPTGSELWGVMPHVLMLHYIPIYPHSNRGGFRIIRIRPNLYSFWKTRVSLSIFDPSYGGKSMELIRYPWNMVNLDIEGLSSNVGLKKIEKIHNFCITIGGKLMKRVNLT